MSSGSGAKRKDVIPSPREKEFFVVVSPKVGTGVSLIGVSFTTGGRTVKMFWRPGAWGWELPELLFDDVFGVGVGVGGVVRITY